MYTLTPIIHPNSAEFLSDHERVHAAVAAFGSPVNVLFPTTLRENILGFRSVFESFAIDGVIHYAHKPNKALSFVREARAAAISIDVASEQELLSAFRGGFEPSRIEATGPKPPEFIELCVLLNITVNVDSIHELEQVIRLSSKYRKRTPALLRIAAHSTGSYQKYPTFDRFGMSPEEIAMAVDMAMKHRGSLLLRGFSYHINTNSIEARIRATEQALSSIVQAQQTGLGECTVLDIGGGFQASFLESKKEWDDFLSHMKEYAAGRNPDKLSYNGTKYGYTAIDTTVRGSYSFQDFYNPTPKEQFLHKLLSSPLPAFENRVAGSVLSDMLIQLWVEPGQALLDQCGMTLCRILDIKKAQREHVLVVQMNYTNLDADRYELFTDPVLIPREPRPDTPAKGYYISGNLCLSIDQIMNHKVYLKGDPQPGDILAFINTAAYRMDFVESTPLQNPVAEKICVRGRDIIRDHHYYP